jgi:hypothetical protein
MIVPRCGAAAMGTVTMRRFDLGWTSACGLLACSLACGGSDNANAPPIDTLGTDSSAMTLGTESMTGSTTTETTTGSTEPTVDPDSSSTGGPQNCDDFQCTGHGTCEIGEDDKPYCACDPGYVLAVSGDTCVVDESCVQVRFLEDRCRQVFDGVPAVALFFAVEFCAGTAVLPDKLAELELEFQVLENDVDIQENVESYATVIPKPVESYVDLVIDVSDSITESQDLPALIQELRTLVASLVPDAEDPDVYVSVHVFGRDSAEYVPFTRDLAAVDDALAAIADDPTAVVTLAGNGNGTDLYDAVELGILRTQRIRDLRDAVTWGGVLTTGTVVVVTDGNDTSNGMLDTSLIADTTNNVISIGISAGIINETLQEIGRDGSFLAPTPAEWPEAFAEITQRVDEYPLRSYLLGYCSSTTEGSPNVEISISAPGVTVMQTAVCQFDADLFSTNPSAVCDAQFFETECADASCSGLTACGSCADSECCDGAGGCQAPALEPGIGGCATQDDVCSIDEQICGSEGACVDPEPPASGSCGLGCEPGVTHCSDGQCAPVLDPGDICEGPLECPGLNCQRENPDNMFQDTTCRPRALMYDRCGSGDAICETGAYCQSECLPRKREVESCGDGNECRLALCQSLEGSGNICNGEAACFWSWDSKAI